MKKDKKFNLFKEDDKDRHVYLEMSDLSDTAVQIWQNSDGLKETYIRIKFKNSEIEKIIKEYQRIKTTKNKLKNKLDKLI